MMICNTHDDNRTKCPKLEVENVVTSIIFVVRVRVEIMVRVRVEIMVRVRVEIEDRARDLTLYCYIFSCGTFLEFMHGIYLNFCQKL